MVRGGTRSSQLSTFRSSLLSRKIEELFADVYQGIVLLNEVHDQDHVVTARQKDYCCLKLIAIASGTVVVHVPTSDIRWPPAIRIGGLSHDVFIFLRRSMSTFLTIKYLTTMSTSAITSCPSTATGRSALDRLCASLLAALTTSAVNDTLRSSGLPRLATLPPKVAHSNSLPRT